MPSLRLTFAFPTIIAVVGLALLRPASALTISYCSTINTSSNQQNSSIYQSNGLCHDFCDSTYAFAVLQGSECWCSDFVPASTVQTGQCDYSCPGYQSDLCGGFDLYGYIALGKKAVGTKGPSSTATNMASQATSQTNPDPSSPTWTGTPIVSIQTVTGQVQTITYTPTPPPSTANQAGLDKGGSGSLNTGQAVGLTFGLVALALLIAGIIFFCVRKRNKQKKREAEAEAAAGAFSRTGSGNTLPTPQRTMSENSRFMLQTDGRQVVEGWESGDTGTPGSRISRLLPVDPRLDPYAGVYQRGDGSKSRESVQTIQDNHDYSRRVIQQGPILRATNPD